MHDMSMMTDADLKVSLSTSYNCDDMLQMLCFSPLPGSGRGKTGRSCHAVWGWLLRFKRVYHARTKKKVKRAHCGGLGEILGTRLGSQKQNKNKNERRG